MGIRLLRYGLWAAIAVLSLLLVITYVNTRLGSQSAGVKLGTPFNLLKEVQKINEHQLTRFLDAIREALWVLKEKKIAVWGISFKPNTDDVRSSVAVNIIETLVSEGAEVTAYDPKAMEKFQDLPVSKKVKLATSPLEAARGAEALIIATEWPEFTFVDLAELRDVMRAPLVFDGRNLLDPSAAAAYGFQYRGIGRGTLPQPS